MTIATGIVLEVRAYKGDVTPPATILEDTSRYKTHGAFKADGQPNWVKNPNGLWELDFNSGTADYVEVTAPQLNFTSGNFSAILAVKVDDLSNSPYLFSRGAVNADGWHLYFSSSGMMVVVTNQAAANQLSYGEVGAVNEGKQNILGFSRSGAAITTYRQGIADTASSGTHINPLTSSRTVKMSIRDDKISAPLNGKIFYVAIWNYALSPEEHAAKHYELKQWG